MIRPGAKSDLPRLAEIELWNEPFYGRFGFEELQGGGGFAHLDEALAEEMAVGLRNRVAMARRAA